MNSQTARISAEVHAKRVAASELLYWKQVAAQKFGCDVSIVSSKRITEVKENQQHIVGDKVFNLNIVPCTYRVGEQTDWYARASHFQVKIWMTGLGKGSLILHYSQGSAVLTYPRADEIFESLVSDALMGSRNFFEFCDQTGSDADSRSAFRTYQECCDVAKWFAGCGIYEGMLQDWYMEMDHA